MRAAVPAAIDMMFEHQVFVQVERKPEHLTNLA